MKIASMHEAKTHLSRLVDRALAGEEVVIARRNRPLVRLAVLSSPAARRSIGSMPGLLRAMGDDFNAPLEDWEGRVEPKRVSAGKPRRPR